MVIIAFTTMTPAAKNFSVHILDWNSARALARPLRETVFVHEQGVPIEEEWDEWDAGSEHAIAATVDGEPIGTARLLPQTLPHIAELRIGRMAVLKAWRRRGVGAALLAALIERAADRGAQGIVLHAQTHAAGFYQRCGFVAEGGEFFEAGIAHFTMRLRLANRPG